MRSRVLLTGVTGFLGSHIAIHLIKQGFEVVGLKRRTSSIERLESIVTQIELIDVDAGLDFDWVFQSIKPISVIVHTATCYGRNNESISEIFASNTEFPLKLLDAGSRAGVKAFLNTDTILDQYLNIYAFSKKQLLEWGRFFVMQKKITFWNIRLEHFYGPYDDKNKFTGYIIDCCLNNVPKIKLTLGEQRRDFIYIEDVVSAYLLLIEKIQCDLLDFREFDVGSGKSFSVADFVKFVKKTTGADTELDFGALPYRAGEVMNSVANIQPLAQMGWVCKNDIQSGIAKILEVQLKKP